jgi:hypothetical protein
VLKGEAEETLPRFLQAPRRERREGLKEIPGLAAMRERTMWVDNPHRR